MVGVYLEGVCDFESTEELTRLEITATADDDQGLECDLHTGPEFGCNHFDSDEELEEEEPEPGPENPCPRCKEELIISGTGSEACTNCPYTYVRP